MIYPTQKDFSKVNWLKPSAFRVGNGQCARIICDYTVGSVCRLSKGNLEEEFYGTCQPKPKRKLIFQPGRFRCNLNFRDGTCFFFQQLGGDLCLNFTRVQLWPSHCVAIALPFCCHGCWVLQKDQPYTNRIHSHILRGLEYLPAWMG